jgi:cell division protein FtsI/penicillin-binding protein 2
LGAHVLGYVDGSHRGLTGIERQFDSLLRAYDGARVTERDALGEALWIYKKEEILPHDGFDVQLTVDQVIQGALEEELQNAMDERQPDGAMGIVMRPRTGEILAMAACPTFDPNAPGKKFPGDTELAALDRLRNRCIADVAEPGSTFKIVTVAGALDKGVVTLSDAFDCHMPWFFCGVPLRDSHHYGTLTVKEIITKSSNIGAGKIGATRLGQQRLYDYIKAFGFGSRTCVQLPGEVNGIVHPPKAWSAISIAHIPMGHEVAVTPLQMVTAMSAIANGGLRMQPMIVNGVRDRAGQLVGRFDPKPVCQVIRKETADLMVEALMTVTEKGGTGTRGAVPGFEVAGKTGTAQKLEGGHYVQKYYSSFVGFFPARQPEICILISLDNPHDPKGKYYGGAIAAPVFAAVAGRVAKYLSVRPDRPVEERAVQTAKTDGHFNTAQNHAN